MDSNNHLGMTDIKIAERDSQINMTVQVANNVTVRDGESLAPIHNLAPLEVLVISGDYIVHVQGVPLHVEPVIIACSSSSKQNSGK